MAAGAATAAGVLEASRPGLFEPYLGHLNPYLAVVLASALGALSIWYLQSHTWFRLFRSETIGEGVLLAGGGATVFAFLMIVVDLGRPFPKTLNVPLPEAWLFYPAMAYLVEMALHATPLALLLGAGSLFKQAWAPALLWSSIFVTALLEPSLQLGFGLSALVGFHVFAFNLFQLWLFRRYDLVSMLSARLAYYLEWHILWGHLRLQLLS
jgi:hypothetical protein